MTKASTSTGPCAIGMRTALDHRSGRRPPAARQRGRHRSGSSATARSTTIASCATNSRRGATGSGPASDCERCCHLYEEHGDEFVRRLNGMFAFALWDARRRRLLIGRDRLGIKPLYICTRRAGACVRQRSEGVAGGAGRCAPSWIRSRAGLLSRAGLRAGAAVDVPRHAQAAAGDAADRRGRAASAAPLLARPRRGRPHVAARRSGSRGARAPRAKRCGCRWSATCRSARSSRGGIDSSAVVAFMAAAQRPPGQDLLDRLRRRCGRVFYNELPMRARVAERFGTDHHEIVVTPDVVSLLPRLLWHMDEPIADTAFITTYLVSRVRAPRRHGDPVRRGRRRAVRRLSTVPGRPLPGAISSACRVGPRGATVALGGQAPERSPFAAAERRRASPRDSCPRPDCRSRSATDLRAGVLRPTMRGSCC